MKAGLMLYKQSWHTGGLAGFLFTDDDGDDNYLTVSTWSSGTKVMYDTYDDWYEKDEITPLEQVRI